MTGDVYLDDKADREPMYGVSHVGPETEAFTAWTNITLSNPINEVSTKVLLS